MRRFDAKIMAEELVTLFEKMIQARETVRTLGLDSLTGGLGHLHRDVIVQEAADILEKIERDPS